MANFHTNLVVIAAKKKEMLSVLRAMAESLCAHQDETGRRDLLLDAMNVRNAYSRVRGDLRAFYWCAFTPASIGSEEWMRAHPDYQRDEMNANESYAAIAALTESNKERTGMDVSVRVQPSSRLMSQTANVSMDRFGEAFVLAVDYSIEWDNNFDDVEALFWALPEGEYGLAFLDADEGDSYNRISLLSCISNGASPDGVFSSMVEETCSAEELYERAKESCRNDLSVCTDLSEIALSCAMSGWPKCQFTFNKVSGFDGDGVELYGQIDCTLNSSDHESLDGWRHGNAGADVYSYQDFRRPTKDLKTSVRQNVAALLKQFPVEYEVTGDVYLGWNANIEHLVPGAVVLLKSDWNNPGFKGAGIEVLDTSGRRLGNLGGLFNPTDLDRVTIACLLPHITATAVDVLPLGAAVDGKRKQGQFTLHLEIGPLDLVEAMDEVGEVLSEKIADRTRQSILPE